MVSCPSRARLTAPTYTPGSAFSGVTVTVSVSVAPGATVSSAGAMVTRSSGALVSQWS